jgi:hypothetical protein
MIERFNFYDVYGYLIPGALLAAVIWFPHALVQRLAIPTALTAAVAAVIGVYIAGHLLQVIATNVLPSTEPVKTANGIVDRYPSDRLLDSEDKTLPASMKEQLMKLIQARFAIDAKERENRAAAFLLCRNSVIAGKTASYVEQLQGMYALMRGISAAAAIGCAYDLGWLWSAFIDHREPAVRIAVFITIGVVAARYQWNVPKAPASRRLLFAALLLLTVTGAGVVAANGASRDTGMVSTVASLSLLAALWTFGAYRAFAHTWAKTVYQHFYLSSQTPAPAAKEDA